MTMNLQVPPPHIHTENCVCDVSICKSGGGDFIRNAAKMFSFDPIPTRTKKAWSSSTCLLYGFDVLTRSFDSSVLAMEEQECCVSDYDEQVQQTQEHRYLAKNVEIT